MISTFDMDPRLEWDSGTVGPKIVGQHPDAAGSISRMLAQATDVPNWKPRAFQYTSIPKMAEDLNMSEDLGDPKHAIFLHSSTMFHGKNDHEPLTRVGKCPDQTSPNYWG